MNEYDDDFSISEKYKKYIIRLRMEWSFYALWGTDLQTGEEDKLLLDAGRKLLLFDTIGDLRRFMLDNPHLLFDANNALCWAMESKDSHEYAEYDLKNIIEMLTAVRVFDVDAFKYKAGMDIINFINLADDYYLQTQDKRLEALVNGNNIKLFWDFIYDTCFWSVSEEEEKELQREFLMVFNYDAFRTNMLSLITAFKAICKRHGNNN